jgi:hypothetical protein
MPLILVSMDIEDTVDGYSRLNGDTLTGLKVIAPRIPGTVVNI